MQGQFSVNVGGMLLWCSCWGMVWKTHSAWWVIVTFVAAWFAIDIKPVRVDKESEGRG